MPIAKTFFTALAVNVMMKCLKLSSLVFIFLLQGCIDFGSANKETPEEEKEPVVTNIVSKTVARSGQGLSDHVVSIYTVLHDNHWWVYSYGVAFFHHPDCPCGIGDTIIIPTEE